MEGSMHASSDRVPRRFRRRFLVKPLAKWLVPLARCIALPFAERRKRFLVPLWVLILVFALALVIDLDVLFPANRFGVNREE